MFITRLARAAQRADQIIYSIVDKLSGNAARRSALRRRFHAVMIDQRVAELLQLSVNGGHH